MDGPFSDGDGSYRCGGWVNAFACSLAFLQPHHRCVNAGARGGRLFYFHPRHRRCLLQPSHTAYGDIRIYARVPLNTDARNTRQTRRAATFWHARGSACLDLQHKPVPGLVIPTYTVPTCLPLLVNNCMPLSHWFGGLGSTFHSLT